MLRYSNLLNCVPKENTHLYFANKLIENTQRQDWKDLISAYWPEFYLGSVMPDTFYYSRRQIIRDVSEVLHGRHGDKTNGVVFDLLDAARESGKQADLVFALGYLTHCALDITFHPVVYYLSGNYFHPDRAKRLEAVYLHRHLETFLDHKINHEFYFHDLVRLDIIKRLAFPEVFLKRFGMPKNETGILIRRKNLLSFLSDSKLFYRALELIRGFGVPEIKALEGLLYVNIDFDKRIMPDVIDYRDIFTGELKRVLITELFDRADALASSMIDAGLKYHHGLIDRVEAERFIRGESLNTGEVGKGVEDIRYFAV